MTAAAVRTASQALPGAIDDLLSRPIVLVVALAIVSLLPFAFMTVTAFVKIATVLQIVRSAIGAQGVPSGTVVMALAAALTFIAMTPLSEKIAARAAPLLSDKQAAGADTVVLVERGIDAVREPLREFLKANASDIERARFLDVARSARPVQERQNVGADDLTVLVPAFVVTELSEAFAIGFLI
jgi:type III secretion protein R